MVIEEQEWRTLAYSAGAAANAGLAILPQNASPGALEITHVALDGVIIHSHARGADNIALASIFYLAQNPPEALTLFFILNLAGNTAPL
jgi:hypothetical protein